MSANAAMLSNRSSISRRDSPRIAPFMNTLSRPVASMSKPEPSSSSAATRPLTATSPCVGASVPAMICSRVLLPLPFRPMMPTASPRSTVRLTSSSAVNSW